MLPTILSWVCSWRSYRLDKQAQRLPHGSDKRAILLERSLIWTNREHLVLGLISEGGYRRATDLSRNIIRRRRKAARRKLVSPLLRRVMP